MNSLTSSFQPPKVPTEPPQDGYPRNEGVDPAALIAARTAAVARNRRQNARTALLQDVLRIICVVVLVAGIVWVMHLKHKQRIEEERLAAEHRLEEMAALAKEREAEAARQAAVRKEQMEARKAAEAEQRRRQEEKQRVAEQNAEAVRIQKANVKRYQSALDRFNGAILNLIAAAPPSDIPAKVVNETWFSCLLPGGRAGFALYEILASPGKEIRVVRLEADGKVEDVPFKEFNALVSKSPYLLSKGAYCYYSSPGKGEQFELRVPVPVEGESLNPSIEDFRDLYGIVRRRSMVTSAFAYDVFFRDIGGAETRILSVLFGGTVTRNNVLRGLQSTMGQQRTQGDALKSRMNQGKLIIRRKGVNK